MKQDTIPLLNKSKNCPIFPGLVLILFGVNRSSTLNPQPGAWMLMPQTPTSRWQRWSKILVAERVCESNAARFKRTSLLLYTVGLFI